MLNIPSCNGMLQCSAAARPTIRGVHAVMLHAIMLHAALAALAALAPAAAVTCARQAKALHVSGLCTVRNGRAGCSVLMRLC
jgi:hypothetical protein